MADSRLTPEALDWIGRRYPDQDFVATLDSIRRFAYATGETNPIHFDRAAALAAGHPDVIAPPMYYTVIRTYPYHTVPLDRLGVDGIPTEDLPPIQFTRGVAGESRAIWLADIVAGDRILATKRIADIYEKEARSGRLVFLAFEFEFRKASGQVAVTERLTRVLM